MSSGLEPVEFDHAHDAQHAGVVVGVQALEVFASRLTAASSRVVAPATSGDEMEPVHAGYGERRSPHYVRAEPRASQAHARPIRRAAIRTPHKKDVRIAIVHGSRRCATRATQSCAFVRDARATPNPSRTRRRRSGPSRQRLRCSPAAPACRYGSGTGLAPDARPGGSSQRDGATAPSSRWPTRRSRCARSCGRPCRPD